MPEDESSELFTLAKIGRFQESTNLSGKNKQSWKEILLNVKKKCYICIKIKAEKMIRTKELKVGKCFLEGSGSVSIYYIKNVENGQYLISEYMLSSNFIDRNDNRFVDDSFFKDKTQVADDWFHKIEKMVTKAIAEIKQIIDNSVLPTKSFSQGDCIVDGNNIHYGYSSNVDKITGCIPTQCLSICPQSFCCEEYSFPINDWGKRLNLPLEIYFKCREIQYKTIGEICKALNISEPEL